jgi:hypothetical protein
MAREYGYVGSPTARERAREAPPGAIISDRASLARWLRANADALLEGATYVVDRRGSLRLAPRRSEHVACAGEPWVLAAGEVEFGDGGASLARLSNQSSGFCPEPETLGLVQEVFATLGLQSPGRFDPECHWRRCECGQVVLRKEGDDACPCCGTTLPTAWNLATGSPAGR